MQPDQLRVHVVDLHLIDAHIQVSDIIRKNDGKRDGKRDDEERTVSSGGGECWTSTPSRSEFGAHCREESPRLDGTLPGSDASSAVGAGL